MSSGKVRSRSKAATRARAEGRAEGDLRRRTVELEKWFRGAARELPWRVKPRSAYHALVAEAMLQQTQVSRVVGYFERFVARFPDVRALAAADESEVLALWAGLGYYRRARHLHAAARQIVERHGGQVPGDAELLRALPGVGAYTAGSIASIVFGRAEAIVDGNVQRVLMRLHGRDVPPSSREAREWAWERARELVRVARDPAAFNEGMMELGATVCVPAPGMPRCGQCPWGRRGACVARRMGRQSSIPTPKARGNAKGKRLYMAVFVARDGQGRLLLTRRGADGLWAGLWQPPTVESNKPIPVRAMEGLAAGLGWLGLRLEPRGGRLKVVRFSRWLSHREVRVMVVEARAGRRFGGSEVGWAEADLGGYGVSSLHAQAITLVAGEVSRPSARRTVAADR